MSLPTATTAQCDRLRVPERRSPPGLSPLPPPPLPGAAPHLESRSAVSYPEECLSTELHRPTEGTQEASLAESTSRGGVASVTRGSEDVATVREPDRRPEGTRAMTEITNHHVEPPASVSSRSQTARSLWRGRSWCCWLGVFLVALLATLLYGVFTYSMIGLAAGRVVALSEVTPWKLAVSAVGAVAVFIASAWGALLTSAYWSATGRAVSGRETAVGGSWWKRRRRDRRVTSMANEGETGRGGQRPLSTLNGVTTPSPSSQSVNDSTPRPRFSDHELPGPPPARVQRHLNMERSLQRSGGPSELAVAEPVPPPHFLCPITGQVFRNPVLADDGHNYERDAIHLWLQLGSGSPIRGDDFPIHEDRLRPNTVLAESIREWKVTGASSSQREATTRTSHRKLSLQNLHLSSTVLGTGSYKTVVAGKYLGLAVAVAVLRDGASVEAEAAVMRLAGHHRRVLGLVGTARAEDGTHYLVTELAAHGSLSDALGRLVPHAHFLSPVVLLKLAVQVCEGMQALTGAGVAHGDLGARNILLFADLNPHDHRTVNVQIADFGRSTWVWRGEQRGVGQRGVGEDRPVRYMSPEALGFDAQNEKTDVWGFGVLLWECATMGKIPYSHISDDEEVVRGVMAGSLRLYQPSGMPTSLFNLMDCCLNHSAEDRPRFAQIKVALVRIAEEMGALGLCTRL